MRTYQDFLRVPDNEKDRAEFVRSFIMAHKDSDLYETAKIADDYDRVQNTTIMTYQKTITDLTGRVSVDNLSPVHRSATAFFHNATTQLNQYLLGNGVMWKTGKGAKLGDDFDNRLQDAGKKALCGGVAFGFYNFGKVEVFSALEFAPLYDEENGSLMAGVRFWQVDEAKPLRATLYTVDGITEYQWKGTRELAPSQEWKIIDEGVYFIPRKAYTQVVVQSVADGLTIYDGMNYPSFPIVPLWANAHHQSEIVGLREKIDAYDMITNGFEDDLDNAQLYWIIKGAGGMDDPDLMQFLDRLRTVKAAAPADGQEVNAVTVQIPYEARERLLDRLEKQMYRDAMLMNPEDIASGAVTATQIQAAYERQNVKADAFEYQINEFIHGLLSVAGVEDEPTFTRSKIVNVQEEITSLIQAAPFLDEEYVTRKLLTLFGDGDQAEEVLKRMAADGYDRLAGVEE